MIKQDIDISNRCPHADEERNEQIHVIQFTAHTQTSSGLYSGGETEEEQISHFSIPNLIELCHHWLERLLVWQHFHTCMLTDK